MNTTPFTQEELDKRIALMDSTLHQLSLKFIVREKLEGSIIAVFISATDAFDYCKKLGSDYEVKEVY